MYLETDFRNIIISPDNFHFETGEFLLFILLSLIWKKSSEKQNNIHRLNVQLTFKNTATLTCNNDILMKFTSF